MISISRVRSFLTVPALLTAAAAGPLSAQDVVESYAYTNRLVHETSPYLLLHAHNPVNWYPWGSDAFEKARREQKPIFLSIGYYTCHWCHVMEQESYSNPEIAKVLNQYFIAVKVDREERPDVDRLYIAYLEATMPTAGWPANVVLTPELKPFFGGVYFTPDQLQKILMKIEGDWSKDRNRITRQADRAAQQLIQEVSRSPSAAGAPVKPATLDKAFRQLAAAYDRTYGGFGEAPKFPRPVTLEFLLRYYARTEERSALDMALATLRKMAHGGIYDQIGGGFHRYSTDSKWRVPHFEKMLYDQAQLASIYTEAYQISHDSFFADVARDILDFALREMRLPGGGFGSALDADSAVAAGKRETREGALYVWTADEIERVLGRTDAALFSYAFGVESGGNVPTAQNLRGDLTRENIFYRARTDDDVAKRFGLSPAQISEKLAAARRALFEARSRRPQPPRDGKIVTAWNGMMILALARASQAFEEPRYLDAAEATARFLRARLYDEGFKRLWRSFSEGNASVEGFLDDYTGLIKGLIGLYQGGFDIRWLQWAVELQDQQDKLFWDAQQGAYFDSAAGDTALLARTRESEDAVEPSPNSAAAMNLLRLAQIAGRADWQRKAREVFAAFGERLAVRPEAVPALTSALDFDLAHTRQIVIAGNPSAGDTRTMLRLVNQRFLPNAILLLADAGPGQEQLGRWRPDVAEIRPLKGRATIYVCENFICKLPTADPLVAARLLESKP